MFIFEPARAILKNLRLYQKKVDFLWRKLAEEINELPLVYDVWNEMYNEDLTLKQALDIVVNEGDITPDQLIDKLEFYVDKNKKIK